jgi:hypothetical protein
MQTGKTSFGSAFSQVAWVVPDILAAEKFFKNVLGIGSFAKLENLQSRELDGNY